MGSTAISYCTRTWGLGAGCDQQGGPGCVNCWAARLASTRLRHHPLYRGLAKDGRWTGEIRVNEAALREPQRWQKPQVVFVGPMTDFFLLPLATIAAASTVMAECPQHTFLIVTHHAWALDMYEHVCGWSLPENVYLLPTCENQAQADKILPVALQTGAKVVANLEPLLGPVNLQKWIASPDTAETDVEPTDVHCLRCGCVWEGNETRHECPPGFGRCLAGVILGGESGPGARPMHPTWARDVRDQCEAAGVPYYHKQNGEYIECEKRGHIGGEHYAVDPRKHTMIVYPDGHSFEYKSNWDGMDDGIAMERVGTRAAGHLLDGREHRKLPWRKW